MSHSTNYYQTRGTSSYKPNYSEDDVHQIDFRKTHTIDAFTQVAHVFDRPAKDTTEAQQLFDALYDILLRLGRAYGAIEVDCWKLDICTRLTFLDKFVAEKYLLRCVLGNTATTRFDAPTHVSTHNGWLMEMEGAIYTLELIQLKQQANEKHGIYELLEQAQRLLPAAISQCQKMDGMLDLLLISEGWFEDMSARQYDDIEMGLGHEWMVFKRCLERKDGHVERAARMYLQIVVHSKSKY
jgi:hypothetical protein